MTGRNTAVALRRHPALLLLAVLVSCIAWSQERRIYRLEGQSQENFTAGGTFNPFVSAGAILIVKHNQSDAPELVRFGFNGEFERIPLAIAGAHRLTIYAVSSNADGAVAASGSALSDEGGGKCFLLRIQRDRKQQLVKWVTDGAPQVVALPPDGTLWSIGPARDGTGGWRQNVLKRFDRDGSEIDSRVVKARGKVIHGDDPGVDKPRDATVFSSLRASNDRVGWMTNGNEYIEFDLEGREVLRLDGPANESTYGVMAYGSNSEVVMTAIQNQRPTYWTLDRPGLRWVRAMLEGPDLRDPVLLLLGFERQTLAATPGNGLVYRFKLLEDVK